MAPRNLKQLLLGLGGALAGAAAMHYGRDLPWRLAGIVGLAIGVLVVSVLQSGERVRAAWRRGPGDGDRS